MRIRKNLGVQGDIPKSTTAFDINKVHVQLDEEVYRDVQHLAAFFAWHSKSVSAENHYIKYRPPYNTPIRGNAKLFWKYAINSILYQLQKVKKAQAIAQVRQAEMLELS